MADTLTPDYDVACDNCNQKPTVVVNGVNSELCGPCMFGESDCIDPKEWQS